MCEGTRQEELGLSEERKIRPGEEGTLGSAGQRPKLEA